MLMPDITAVLFDPTVGSRPFEIRRRRGKWVGGRFVIQGDVEIIPARGCIQPQGAENMSQSPEGEKREGGIVIYTTTTIYLTEGEEVSDEVIWQGEKYKIMSVNRWQEHGFNVANASKR